MNAPLPMDAVLCYVDGPWAWFTTQPLADQWGDDWDDAPYEHNAEDPYGPRIYHHADGQDVPNPQDHHPDGTPKWRVFRVAWEGPFVTPDHGALNIWWSVQQINAGAVAWLSPHPWERAHETHIPAGTTLADFLRLVRREGGTVYLPAEAA